MGDFTKTLLPLFLFMLIPIWIPIVAVAFSWVRDLAKPRKTAPARSRHLVAVRATELG